MATKFVTDSGRRWSTRAEIVPIEVEKETESSVWISGNRHAKSSDNKIFHDSWEDAKSYLVSVAHRKVIAAKSELERTEKLYVAVAELTKPE